MSQAMVKVSEADEKWYTLELDVKPEQRDAFLQMFAECRTEVLKNPGIIQYELCENTTDPNKFNLWQGYQSSEVLQKHMQSPHTKKMLGGAEPMLAQPFKQTSYKQAAGAPRCCQDPEGVWFTLELDVKPEQRDAFLAVFAECQDETLKEIGILQYDLVVNETDENKFNLLQGYKSSEVVQNHMKLPHSTKMLAAAGPMLAQAFAQTNYKKADTRTTTLADEMWYTLELDIKPEQRDAFLAMLAECRAEVLKGSSGRGILQYELRVHTANPNKFNLWQGYQSSEVVQKHMQAPHTQKMLGGAQPMLAQPFTQTNYKALFNAAGVPRSAQDNDAVWYTLELDVKPEQRDAFLAVFAECREETLKEVGILQYDLVVNEKDENKFNLMQGYKSSEVVQNHMKFPHSQKMLAAAGPMLTKAFTQTNYK